MGLGMAITWYDGSHDAENNVPLSGCKEPIWPELNCPLSFTRKCRLTSKLAIVCLRIPGTHDIIIDK